MNTNAPRKKPGDLKPPKGPHLGPPPKSNDSFEKGYKKGLDHSYGLIKVLIKDKLTRVSFMITLATNVGILKEALDGNLKSLKIFCEELIESIDEIKD